MEDFLKTEEIEIGGGFPQGDTMLNLKQIDIEPSEYQSRPNFKITVGDKTYFAPKTVARDLREIFKQGVPFARVTRTGKAKDDTRYTVIGVNKPWNVKLFSHVG